MKKGEKKKKEMVKNFNSKKVNEAGMPKYRGRKSSNQKALLSRACRKHTIL